MELVVPAIAFVKHPAFQEEREWRMILPQWGLPANVKFRTSRIGLVPYCEVPFEHDAVARVIVVRQPHLV